MNLDELAETHALILNDASAIAHNQQVLARIHDEIRTNIFNPFEQDFVYEDHFGQRPSEPRQFLLNGVQITTRILHQTGVGLRDIVGADLLYEIEDHKFGLIQYKRANNRSIKNDTIQLETLLNNCPEICTNKRKRPIPIDWIPLRLNSFCGVWYCVFDNNDRRYVHACEAESIFRGKKSARSRFFEAGLTQESFLNLFSSCRIGALLQSSPSLITREIYISQLLEQKHMIFEVKQQAKWPQSL